MSAHAYIQWADVPQPLIDSSKQRIDGETRAQIVAFDGCPFCGEISDVGGALQVELPFPRIADLRDALIEWFMHHGISFTVVM